MMMEPKIRLKGFCGEWKDMTIAKVLLINSGRDYKHLSEGDIPVYGTGGYMLSVNESLSSVDAIGIGRKGTIDKPQYLKAPFWTVDTLFFMTPQKGFDLSFIYNLCQKINWRNYDESTGVPSLSKNNINSIDVSAPSLPEQRALATFFTSLDNQISAAEKRLASLKQVKAASLQAMFPQEGETTPKLRFKGCEGEWKKEKLGECGTFSKGKGYSKADICAEGTPIILYGSMYTNNSTIIDKVDTYAKINDGAVLSKGGEIIIPASGETPEDIAIASVVKRDGILLGGDLNIITLGEGYDPTFIALGITYSKTHVELSKYAQGKSVVHLHNSEIAQGSIMCPNSLTEQRQIASYFTALDRQLSAQSSKISKLKQIKSACLDQMFV